MILCSFSSLYVLLEHPVENEITDESCTKHLYLAKLQDQSNNCSFQVQPIDDGNVSASDNKTNQQKIKEVIKQDALILRIIRILISYKGKEIV